MVDCYVEMESQRNKRDSKKYQELRDNGLSEDQALFVVGLHRATEMLRDKLEEDKRLENQNSPNFDCFFPSAIS